MAPVLERAMERVALAGPAWGRATEQEALEAPDLLKAAGATKEEATLSVPRGTATLVPLAQHSQSPVAALRLSKLSQADSLETGQFVCRLKLELRPPPLPKMDGLGFAGNSTGAVERNSPQSPADSRTGGDQPCRRPEPLRSRPPMQSTKIC